MKKAELSKLRAKTVNELEKLAAEKGRTIEKSKNDRRDLAQILTVIGEVKLNENIDR